MNRRKWLTRIVQGFSISGLAFLTYPFFRFMFSENNDISVLEISIAELKPGESKRIIWKGRNILITKRTESELALLKSASGNHYKDPESRLSRQPVFATNSFRSQRPDIFVTYLNCTHLGCEVSLIPDGGSSKFNCPCHQSEYDAAGRVLKGAAAPFNLEIPEYRFLSKSLLAFGNSKR